MIKRKRKLSGRLLLESLLFGRDWSSLQSLQDMSLDILKEHQTSVSLQAINKKLGPACVSFLKEVFETLLSQLKPATVAQPANGIHRLLIKDSTRIILSTSGLGGPVVSRSLQTEIDLLQGSIEIGIRDGKSNDQGECRADWNSLQSDSLYVRDLGYVSGQYMGQVKAAKSYYLNRLPGNTNLYEKKRGVFTQVSIAEIKRRVRKCGILDTTFYLGKDKYESRVLIEGVPQEVSDKRIKKNDTHNKSHGCRTSEAYKERSTLNFWVTNLPIEQYDTLQVKNLYHLRWQIELIFKTWKSILGMATVGHYKDSRVISELYAKLILAVIHWTCCQALKPLCTVSFYKVGKFMKNTVRLLRAYLFEGLNDWLALWGMLKDTVFSKEKRKQRLIPQELIDSLA